MSAGVVVGVWLLFLLGCSDAVDPSTGDTPSGQDSAADTGTVAELPCDERGVDVDDDPWQAITLSLSTAVSTVGIATWTLTQPAEVRVRFHSGDHVLATPWQPGTAEGSVLLMGMRPSQTYTVQLEAVVDEALVCTAPRDLETQGIGTLAEDFHVNTLQPDAVEGSDHTLLTASYTDGAYAVVLDPSWQPVMAYYTASFVMRARFSVDRSELIYLDYNARTIQAVRLDGGGERQIADRVHHDFVELPDGGFAVLGWELREYDDGTRTLQGDLLEEISVDGTRSTLWHALDNVEVDLDRTWGTGTVDGVVAEDWSHGNYLSYSAEADAYFVSLGNVAAVARIDRATGETAWVASKEYSDVGFEPFLDGVRVPHSIVDLGGDSVMVYDRQLEVGSCASATRWQVDAEAGVATLDWRYTSEHCHTSDFMGDALPLAGGNVTVNFASPGVVDEVAPDGSLVRRLEALAVEPLGYLSRIESFYDER